MDEYIVVNKHTILQHLKTQGWMTTCIEYIVVNEHTILPGTTTVANGMFSNSTSSSQKKNECIRVCKLI